LRKGDGYSNSAEWGDIHYENKKAVLSQGNLAMQHVFPTPNDFLFVICFSLRKVKAVIAPAVICRLKAD